ncbi:pentapeptide repeat-containing protein [Mycobacterium sp. SM1]|uniref:pentapeptide repeat-containing protein n=1 Tax=Mycobacterium sp. SM1 TaxID=2816243 RepID=UPI001BCDFBB7|nr:pentapeptide repeat-containing protein [Mycobacterium sp. SM1]MBS4729886.1 pentapeptide repeat-containing protein [Mycobacterium sp. SM1]
MYTDRDFQAVVRDLRAEDAMSHSRGLQALYELVGTEGASTSVLRTAADMCCAIVRHDGAYPVADPVRDGIEQVLALLLRKLADYTCADLRGAYITRADFDGCNLVGANLTGASLGTARFEGAKLPGARLIGACASAEAVFAGADLTGAELDGFGAPRANLACVTAPGARGCEMSVPEAQAGNSVWLGAVLVGVDFYKAALGGADFRGANLTNAKMRRCQLNGSKTTDFRGANLTGVDMDGATLYDVDFRGANLAGARLTDVMIEKTRWDGAILNGAQIAIQGGGLRL